MDCIVIQSLLLVRLCCSTFFQFSSPDSWALPCKRLTGRSQLIYWTLFTVQFSMWHYPKKIIVVRCLQLFSNNCRFPVYSVSLKFEPKKVSCWAATLCLSTWKTEKDQRKSFFYQNLLLHNKQSKSDLRCGMILPEMNICSADAQEEIKIKA